MLFQCISSNLAGAGIMFLSRILGASHIRSTELVRWCELEVHKGMCFNPSLWGGSVVGRGIGHAASMLVERLRTHRRMEVREGIESVLW